MHPHTPWGDASSDSALHMRKTGAHVGTYTYPLDDMRLPARTGHVSRYDESLRVVFPSHPCPPTNSAARNRHPPAIDPGSYAIITHNRYACSLSPMVDHCQLCAKKSSPVARFKRTDLTVNGVHVAAPCKSNRNVQRPAPCPNEISEGSDVRHCNACPEWG